MFPEAPYVASPAILLFLLRFVVKPKSLKWTIFVEEYHVSLSVEVVGNMRQYYHVVHAAKRSSVIPRIPRRRSFITNCSDDNAVIVDYVPTRNWLYMVPTSNDLQMQLTPEDPDAFLEMMTLALDQRKPIVTFSRGEDDKIVVKRAREGEKHA
jgi:hypothetical protein